MRRPYAITQPLKYPLPNCQPDVGLRNLPDYNA